MHFKLYIQKLSQIYLFRVISFSNMFFFVFWVGPHFFNIVLFIFLILNKILKCTWIINSVFTLIELKLGIFKVWGALLFLPHESGGQL